MRGASLKLLAVVAARDARLGACATLPRSSPRPVCDATDTDSPFSIAGRISARRGDAGVAGAFTWTHDAASRRDRSRRRSADARANWKAVRTASTVRLQDGRTETAATWRELTERAFGVMIPVDGLAAWVRGVPPRGAAVHDRARCARAHVAAASGWMGSRPMPTPTMRPSGRFARA